MKIEAEDKRIRAKLEVRKQVHESANKELQLQADELEELREPEEEPVESPREVTDDPFGQPGEQQHDTKRSAGTTSLREDASPHDEAKEDLKSVKKKLHLPIKDDALLKRRTDYIKVGDDRQDPNEQQRKKKDAEEHDRQAAGDMVGRASPNQTTIEWLFSKRPVTVKTATNGNELSARRTATEQIKARRYTHRMVGVPRSGRAWRGMMMRSSGDCHAKGILRW
jgi:hypothetical protein